MVRRSKTGMSHKVLLEVSSGVCRGQGWQIQNRAVAHWLFFFFFWLSLKLSSDACRGQGLQIEKRAVTEGVLEM